MRSTSSRSARCFDTFSTRKREVDGLQHLLLVLRLDVHERGRQIGQRAGRGGDLEHATSSGGACGSSSIASMAWRCRFSARASISGELVVGSGICWTRAARNGVPGRKSRMRARCTPWQTM